LISDREFFDRNPERVYRLRLASPAEIAALDPAPDPTHFVYMAKCRYVLGIKAVFETMAAPAPNELDDEGSLKKYFEDWSRWRRRRGALFCQSHWHSGFPSPIHEPSGP
jgi:hypothetical protein